MSDATPEQERDTAYRERAHLVALLAALYPSHIGHNDPEAPDWAVLTIEAPTGQMCWHVAPADMDLFRWVTPTPHNAREWDGHTTEEKYQRLRILAESVAENRARGIVPPQRAATAEPRLCHGCGGAGVISTPDGEDSFECTVCDGSGLAAETSGV